MPSTLERILQATAATLPALRSRRSELERAAGSAPAPPRFLSRWDRARIGLIAEVKRRSPSVGAIRPDLDPVAHARAYAASGASAISVLTDGPHFGGSLDDLRGVRQAVAVPVLRKDFILDEVQLLEARAAGASGVLLIVRALAPERLRQLGQAARDLELDVLVETHDAPELELALAAEATVIGVNSRNLDTFSLDVEAAWRLISRVPKDRVAVAESGMHSVLDVHAAAEAGADLVLIGTALSSSPDPSDLVSAITQISRRGR